MNRKDDALRARLAGRGGERWMGPLAESKVRVVKVGGLSAAAPHLPNLLCNLSLIERYDN